MAFILSASQNQQRQQNQMYLSSRNLTSQFVLPQRSDYKYERRTNNIQGSNKESYNGNSNQPNKRSRSMSNRKPIFTLRDSSVIRPNNKSIHNSQYSIAHPYPVQFGVQSQDRMIKTAQDFPKKKIFTNKNIIGESRLSNRQSKNYELYRQKLKANPLPDTIQEEKDNAFIFRPYDTGINKKKVIFISQPQNIEINYDYCGCESKMVPCSKIQSAFLNEIVISEMKFQYLKVFEDANYTFSANKQSNIKMNKLLSFLPSNYPQIFISQLRNLYPLIFCKNTSDQKTQLPFLLLLAYIQYHTKIQYITYFMFVDLQKSLRKYYGMVLGQKSLIIDDNLSNIQSYLNELQNELITISNDKMIKKKLFESLLYWSAHEGIEPIELICQNTRDGRFFKDAFNKHKDSHKENIIGQFEEFIQNYLNSCASILIPITYYARFLSIFKKNGFKVMVKILARVFIKEQAKELGRAVSLWSSGDYRRYWAYVRGWDWEHIFDSLIN